MTPGIQWAPLGALAIVVALHAVGCGDSATSGRLTIRAGHFPNITHAQALVGQATGRFEKALGGKARIDWKVFNAGPSAMEALIAGELDLVYVGPNPAINGYVRSKGEALRIVAGACSGGAALVVRADAPIAIPTDFNGRSLATPQLGNTQDVAARHWLLANGMDWLERGGKVRVLPLANPDQLTLFLKKELDAAWTVEPWVSRLVQEGNGRVFLDEGDLWPDRRYVTTHLVAAKRFLDDHPDLVRAWIEEHTRITDWILEHRDAAMRIANDEIKAETGRALPDGILRSAADRIELTDDPIRASLLRSAERAFELGFLGKQKPDLSGIYALDLLNSVRAAVGRPPVP